MRSSYLPQMQYGYTGAVAPYYPYQNKIYTPAGNVGLPTGVQAQINLYDPRTGKVVHRGSTLPQVNQNYTYISDDMNVSMDGNPKDVQKMRERLLKKLGHSNSSDKKSTGINYIPIDSASAEENGEKQEKDKKQKYIPIDAPSQYKNLPDSDKKDFMEFNTLYGSVAGTPIGPISPIRSSSPIIPAAVAVTPRGKWSFNNGLLLQPGNVTSYSGSGVMLFEMYNGMPSVIMSRTGGGYEDMGGQINVVQLPAGNSTLELNAKNEILEESCYLFQLPGCDLDKVVNNINRYVDLRYNPYGSTYRCYLVSITGAEPHNLQMLFSHNKLAAKQVKLSPEFNETDSICRFTLKELFQAVDSQPTGKLKVNNTDGTVCEISDRGSDIVRELKKKEMLVKTVYVNPYQVNLKKHQTYYYNNPYEFHSFVI
jgi:hypothetical protein